ncbi:SID1 transmembrane family member 1 [Manduca sexta]|uniref:SID1 transmembrane family member 1 n=1 Tax=Manduca sexta TaxID=7130 RepID=UPI00188FE1B5|nr:SID1 transmembrane family member 1 [Manduca sexta]
MLKLIILIGIFNNVYCTPGNIALSPNRTFNYGIYEYDKLLNLTLNSSVEQIMDFSEMTNKSSGFPTRVEIFTNDIITSDFPVFITATQQKGVSSWELPLVIQTNDWHLMFSNMARTLCPHDAGPDIRKEKSPTIHLTTSNVNNITLTIQLTRVTDFYLDVNKEVELAATPSTPQYYYFSFDRNPWNITDNNLQGIGRFNYTIPKSVILVIESDDELCATVSIQNNSCPVFDNEKEIQYQGYHLTMTTKGGITLTQSMFPNGFYVVFVVRESDDACTGEKETQDGLERSRLYSKGRHKNFRFKVVATISYEEYLVGAFVTLAMVVLVAAFVAATLLPYSCKCTEEEIIIEEEAVPSTSGSRYDEPGTSETKPMVDDDDDDEDDWATAPPLTVSRLTQAPPSTLARRADRYFWGALTVAVVYALPVVQLLFTYQGLVFQTGDQDLCYYNFLCAHPLGFLSDFNHVYSNIGYVVLGLVFMLQVRVRQVQRKAYPHHMGIPQHYGLLYSMGLALVMEGVLSACYHLCPNKMNFQFDSSFMYVIAVLVMLKLYQNRHSDIIPSAHSTFMVLALIMTIGLFGILNPSMYFSVFFTILHLFTCLVFTLKIYYAGKFNMEVSVLRRACAVVRAHGRGALVPAQGARAALLAVANILNWSFAIYEIIEHNKDFARQLLAILMGNAILYTMFYVIMKLVNRERIPLHTWAYAVTAHVAWFTALKFFLDSKTKWSETPAQSRRHNAPCSSLRFYDSHDIWHGASAAALYLSFNMLLTMDDALLNTPRESIPTF